MSKYFIICISAFLIFSACSKEDNERSQKYTFSVNGTLDEMPAGPETKMALNHTMKMVWGIGDAVSVVNLTQGMALGGTLAANQEKTTSTFTGTITGNIKNGDRLALVYPSLGYKQEQPFSDAVVDLSSQEGEANDAMFCAVALMNANTEGGNFINAETHFYIKSGMIYVTLADLPVKTNISQVVFPDFYSQIKLSINSSKTDFDISGIKGEITLAPDSKTGTTSSYGIKGLYFGMYGAPAAASRRTVSVICGGDTYESTMTGGEIGPYYYTLSVGAFEKKTSTNGFTFNYDDTEMGDGGTVVIDGSSE